MTPVIVTPPVDLPVSLDQAKDHCRVDHNEDDALIETLVAAATGHLDGWTGVLGRCLLPQTWKVSAEAGDVVLPFPDVTAATAAYAAGDAPLTITATALGPCVTLTEACDVTFTCAMPERLLATARVAILLIVGHWYANRESVGANLAEVPLTADALITQMRWRRV